MFGMDGGKSGTQRQDLCSEERWPHFEGNRMASLFDLFKIALSALAISIAISAAFTLLIYAIV
jgi:hypothetical protein